MTLIFRGIRTTRRFFSSPIRQHFSGAKMKIAVTGARGTVGQEVVQLCSKEGHHTVQVNRTDEEYNGIPNSEMRTADTSKRL